MAAVNELSPTVGTQAACEVLGLPRASYYRQQRPTFGPSKKAVPARALSLTERDTVLACLHEERFQDRSPAAVFAIRSGAARSVEKTTRRGQSVAWEIDVDTSLYRVPNPDGADVVNTIQKMAQKRALVAATLIATSASEFFTQDVEDADTSVDTVSHTPATREAQVHDRKLDERPAKSAVPVEPDSVGKPWKNFGEMRRVFDQVREQVGETRYLEELELAGVQNPGQFQSAGKALECYWRLVRIAAQPEVA